LVGLPSTCCMVDGNPVCVAGTGCPSGG
jgi:hypothetical protein